MKATLSFNGNRGYDGMHSTRTGVDVEIVCDVHDRTVSLKKRPKNKIKMRTRYIEDIHVDKIIVRQTFEREDWAGQFWS